MTSSRTTPRILAVLVLAFALAGCNERKDPGFQGWVEADMIFVSPDESGRVIKLAVREGDEVKPGAPLYSIDDDLQKADLNQNNATLANAQQTYDRAASLSKTGSGTQATLDSTLSALRVAEARVNTSQTRLARRNGFAPVGGTIQQIEHTEVHREELRDAPDAVEGHREVPALEDDVRGIDRLRVEGFRFTAVVPQSS